MLQKLNQKNHSFSIKHVTSESFSKYGRILNSSLYQGAFEYLEGTRIPSEGNFYIAHDQEFADYVNDKSIYADVFGYMPIQFGYVNGNNSYLNALEYHKSSEINVIHTTLVLLLGKVEDINNNEYDSALLEAFYIPENTVVEIYSSTLHFSPCKVTDSGFKCGVILPYGTNMDFVKASHLNSNEDYLLFKTNKWLLAHPDNDALIQKGAYKGIKGTNFQVKY
jgi:hypothetical protein